MARRPVDQLGTPAVQKGVEADENRPRDAYRRSASAFSTARSDSVRNVMTATLLVRE